MTALKRLALHKMALDAVPAGGGLGDGIRFLSDPKRIAASARAAEEWVQGAIVVIRLAADPNPWRDSTNEEIAAELLRRIEARKKDTTNARR